jgi:hypothetical protein
MDDLEDLLRRYRPVGSPPGLRARIVGAARRPAPGPWTWIPSAAAAAAALAFYLLAASARREMSAGLTKIDPYRDASIRALAADLGGDEEAGRVAAMLIEMNEATATSAAGLDPGMPPGVESDGHD